MIACLLIPEFAVAVERVADPALAEAPLLLGEPFHAPERVWAGSAAAARCGIRPGMPLPHARRLCPQARLIPAHPDRYQRALDELRVVLTNFTSRIELAETRPTVINYLDLPQLNQAGLIELAQTIGQTVRDQMGLVPALGLATGKFVARVAAFTTRLGRIYNVAPGRRRLFWPRDPSISCPSMKHWPAAFNC